MGSVFYRLISERDERHKKTVIFLNNESHYQAMQTAHHLIMTLIIQEYDCLFDGDYRRFNILMLEVMKMKRKRNKRFSYIKPPSILFDVLSQFQKNEIKMELKFIHFAFGNNAKFYTYSK